MISLYGNTTKQLSATRSRASAHFVRAMMLAAALAVGSAALVGCGVVPPNVLPTHGNSVPIAKHFPAALLAEPIQLRAGFSYVTQPFPIAGPEERWAVALGFVRNDEPLTTQQRLAGASNTCWTDNPSKPIRLKTCENFTPGFSVKWELLRENSSVAVQYAFDNLRADNGGTYAANAITSTLSGFSNQQSGFYRLRVTVLRDAKELDFLQPHILVNRPFFGSKSIE
ncbi:hypothetical protein ACSFA8_18205 [Variovorax sp. RT4R15]|uniref:hypothetical protein n=1 Tax=Variovorax sp. RT4R15 TaxID=3443737 RepID=UPI003F4899E9